jgi:hypothetical protein
VDVDYVLIYSSSNFQHVPLSAGENRTKQMFDLWVMEGGLLRSFESFSELITDNYYKGCYDKLNVFRYRSNKVQQRPIVRLLNLRLQHQRCIRLERFSS